MSYTEFCLAINLPKMKSICVCLYNDDGTEPSMYLALFYLVRGKTTGDLCNDMAHVRFGIPVRGPTAACRGAKEKKVGKRGRR